jgi:hypothetical protein
MSRWQKLVGISTGFCKMTTPEERDSIERHRLECEARYWMKRVSQMGWFWWHQQKQDIAKKRGDKGLAYLVDEMNRQRTQNESKKRESND